MAELGKNSVIKTIVSEEDQGQRLDNYLLRVCKGVPRSRIYHCVRSGEVRVNSGRVEVSYRLRAGDLLRIPPLRMAERKSDRDAEIVDGKAVKADLPVIFEDEALLAIDKPAGIAVHGGSGVSFGVIEALRRQRPQARFLELAHRLDRETSGVLLVGKKRSALNALHDLFRAGGGVDKRYLVLVSGRWMDPLRNVRLPLLKYEQPSGEKRVRVADEGKPAHTVFRLVARWQRYSLLEAELKTGRTHQIRVHLAHLGYPIAGDDKYGDFTLNRELQREGLKRMFLHARRVSLPHPLSGEALVLEAPLPPALRSFLHHLSQSEAQDHGETF